MKRAALRRGAAAAVAICLLPLVATAQPRSTLAGGPPPTPARPVTDVVHGIELVDHYRWLEGDERGEITPEVAAWTDAQNAWTRSVLDNLPGRAELESRLRELMEVGSVSAPTMRGNRYFYSKREGNQNQAIHYMREGHPHVGDGVPRVLLDPNTMDERGLVTVSWTAPSHDGRLLAFGMFRAGDENSTAYVLDVDRGEWLADVIPGKVGSISWLPDSSGFFYRRLEDVSNPYSGQVMFHRMGTHPRHDQVIFEQYKEGPLSTTWGPWGYADRECRWLVLGYSTGAQSNDLWAVDLEGFFKAGDPDAHEAGRGTGEIVRREIVVGADARSWGPIHGDTLFLHTNLDAPNAKVYAIDLRSENLADRSQWRVVIPEQKNAVLKSISLADGLLVGQYEINAASEIRIFDLGGQERGIVELPAIGSAGISTEEDRTEAFLSFSSFNTPPSIYRIDLRQPAKRELWERPQIPVDPSIVDVKQVWYESRDGTRVPMFIIHRKGLELNGDNPTILYGYGGFNISQTPFFASTLFPWFEAGGVYAVANLRGGGEFGAAWHRAGTRENKQNVFDDFIAAAEWLIDNGYTNPGRLGISGGSNGGLLVGAAVTQRPDLFAAAVCGVPLLDMLRFHQFLMARYWVPEYGSAEDPEQLRWLLAYSPYHNVQPGVKYPAVFFTTGENDTRVHPLHARKMAALMRAATEDDPAARPILLWVDREAGHGSGKPLHLRIRDAADGRMFMMWQLGMLGEQTPPR
jgi:prolyl oligopeptidase